MFAAAVGWPEESSAITATSALGTRVFGTLAAGLSNGCVAEVRGPDVGFGWPVVIPAAAGSGGSRSTSPSANSCRWTAAFSSLASCALSMAGPPAASADPLADAGMAGTPATTIAIRLATRGHRGPRPSTLRPFLDPVQAGEAALARTRQRGSRVARDPAAILYRGFVDERVPVSAGTRIGWSADGSRHRRAPSFRAVCTRRARCCRSARAPRRG